MQACPAGLYSAAIYPGMTESSAAISDSSPDRRSRRWRNLSTTDGR